MTALFTQSAYRTVVIPPSSSLMPGLVSAPLPQWPDKSSDGALDYWVDFRGWLNDCNDELLLVSAEAIRPPTEGSNDPYTLNIGAIVAENGFVVLWLSSGEPATLYEIEVTIVTAAGRTETFLIFLFINEDSPPAPSVPAPEGTLGVSSWDLVSTGSNIDDALPLPALYNVFTGTIPGGGARMTANNVPQKVVHTVVGGDPILIYPKTSLDHFLGLGLGEPVLLPAPLEDGDQRQVELLPGPNARAVSY